MGVKCGGGHRRAATVSAYWQASHVPPLSMASMEQAFFSSAVKVEEVPSEQ